VIDTNYVFASFPRMSLQATLPPTGDSHCGMREVGKGELA